MAKFRIGQKVVQVWTLPEFSHLKGRVGTIVGGPHWTTFLEPEGYVYRVAFPQGEYTEGEEALEPVIENGEYERFREQLLQPVPLDEPVTA